MKNKGLANSLPFRQVMSMTLAEYLKITKTKRRDFAARIAISESVLSRIIRRRRNPTFEIAKAIIEETRGVVSVADMGMIPGGDVDDADDIVEAAE
jgi:hypothetical protein